MLRFLKNYLEKRELKLLNYYFKQLINSPDNYEYFQGKKLIKTKKYEMVYLVHILIERFGFIKAIDKNGYGGQLTYIINDEAGTKTTISIGDILFDKVNQGIGSEALNYLEQIARERNVKCLSGWLSSVDFDHKDRLFHFYKKNGFKIDGSTIIKPLDK